MERKMRFINQELKKWLDSKYRKPLLVRGKKEEQKQK
jgi:hypothetical protein